MGLSSFSPTPSYPHLYLSRYIYLTRLVHDDVHPFDHRLLQPLLRLLGLVGVTLDDHLVMADQDWHGSRALVPTLPQKRQCQLQAVGCGPLDWGVETVGQPVDAHAAPTTERTSLGI